MWHSAGRRTDILGCQSFVIPGGSWDLVLVLARHSKGGRLFPTSPNAGVGIGIRVSIRVGISISISIRIRTSICVSIT